MSARDHVIAPLILLLCLTTPLQALEKWGPFRGQMVDAETGQPIPDAAVLVVWWEADPTPVQTRQKFYDAREAVSGPDGRFEVPALNAPFFSFRIFDPKVSYFAAGYVPEAVDVEPPDGQSRPRWQGCGRSRLVQSSSRRVEVSLLRFRSRRFLGS